MRVIEEDKEDQLEIKVKFFNKNSEDESGNGIESNLESTQNI